MGSHPDRRRSSARVRLQWTRGRLAVSAVAALAFAGGFVTIAPPSAAVEPNALAPTTTQRDCGNGISTVRVAPHAGFDPLTATSAQLVANNLPTRPVGTRNLAIWRRFVTTTKPSLPSCAFGVGHPSARMRPAPRRAGSVKPAAAEYEQDTANWSGDVAINHTYTDAYTYFNVPRPEGTDTADYYKCIWDGVGQGDSNAKPMVQAGAEADFSGAAPHFDLWWEVVPQLSTQHVVDYYVHYDDLIYVHSHLSSNDNWVYIVDESTGFSGTYSYKTSSSYGPDGTAEWIVERTEVDGTYPRLALGGGKFNSADIKATGVAYTSLGDNIPHYYVTMWNCGQAADLRLAYPEPMNSSGSFNTYTAHYGTPTDAASCTSVW